nr:MAG TPA: hypothetical protein [Caudoviricetes sp.]
MFSFVFFCKKERCINYFLLYLNYSFTPINS